MIITMIRKIPAKISTLKLIREVDDVVVDSDIIFSKVVLNLLTFCEIYVYELINSRCVTLFNVFWKISFKH